MIYPINLGQRFFSFMSHRLYDLGLYSFVTEAVWRCKTERLVDHYVANVSSRHLEVGVGTGYFLARTLSSEHCDRLVLADLNARCLAKAGARLARLGPDLWHQDARAPLPSEAGFDSIGMNYVLHCIPGDFQRHLCLFRHVWAGLRTGGVFFGATVVDAPGKTPLRAKCAMGVLNAVGIFHNTQQDHHDLARVLRLVFRRVDVEMVGNTALFRAVK